MKLYRTPEQASRNNFTASVYGISALKTNSSAIPSNLERGEGGRGTPFACKIEYIHLQGACIAHREHRLHFAKTYKMRVHDVVAHLSAPKGHEPVVSS